VTRPFAAATAPNQLRCIDFKGWFRTGDGQRCDPLTLSDAASRYLLVCEIMAPRAAEVAAACERLFRERGLPGALRMDNGPPFASTGAGGLTRLSVGWVKLGIRLERIDPGCPQQNGRHERMHRTLKAETSAPPAASPAAQQARFDAFRRDYNEVRPHEALHQETPASQHCGDGRAYPGRIEEPWYTPLPTEVGTSVLR
jgi:transposase InsO family protein